MPVARFDISQGPLLVSLNNSKRKRKKKKKKSQKLYHITKAGASRVYDAALIVQLFMREEAAETCL